MDYGNFDILGDYKTGCKNGDYVEFSTAQGPNHQISRRLCGQALGLSNIFCGEGDPSFTEFQVVGNSSKKTLVEAVYRVGRGSSHAAFGISVVGYKWTNITSPEVFGCTPKLPMQPPSNKDDKLADDMGIACNSANEVDLSGFQFRYTAYWYPGDESDLEERQVWRVPTYLYGKKNVKKKTSNIREFDVNRLFLS